MTDTQNAALPRDLILATARDLGLTMTSVFVPWSQSRNKSEKHPSLNWKVTLLRNGREFLTTDYMAGWAHSPAYKASVRQMGGANSLMRTGTINFECEHGKAATTLDNASSASGYTVREMHPKGKTLEPDFCDVLHSLVIDASVLDAGGFEEWAGELGYDADSRSAESIYRACLEIALKLRSAIGDAGLQALRDAGQDY